MFEAVLGEQCRVVECYGDVSSSTTIEALEKSIEKWEFIKRWTEMHPAAPLDDGTADSCALCRRFKMCKDCPVAIRIGEKWCKRTPYYAYSRWDEYEKRLKDASDEVAFLKALLRIEESDLFEVEYEDGDARLGLKRDFGNADPLAESIEKWEVIVAICSDPTFKGKVLNADAGTCGLCNEHAYCDDCPVRDSTGRLGCAGTPWFAFWRANDVMNREGVLKAAKAEVEFLKGLCLEAKRPPMPDLVITSIVDQTIYLTAPSEKMQDFICEDCEAHALTYVKRQREQQRIVVKYFVNAAKFAEWLVNGARQQGFTVEVRDA